MSTRPYPWITLCGSRLRPVTLVWSPRENAFVCQHHKWGRMKICGDFEIGNAGWLAKGKYTYIPILKLVNQKREFEREPNKPAVWVNTSCVTWDGDPLFRGRRMIRLRRADITDQMVCEAAKAYHLDKRTPCAGILKRLVDQTGYPAKVVWCAMERACDRGLLEYGTSLNGAWVTKEGEAFLQAIYKERLK